jgi:hypothetical protein
MQLSFNQKGKPTTGRFRFEIFKDLHWRDQVVLRKFIPTLSKYFIINTHNIQVEIEFEFDFEIDFYRTTRERNRIKSNKHIEKSK